jgi:hypothetical protein
MLLAKTVSPSKSLNTKSVYLATSAQVALSLFNMHGASFDISEILALTLALLGALVARSCNTSLQLLWLLFQAVQILIYTSFLMVLLNINF